MAAPKGNNFNPKGRPEKSINWEEFEKLCALQCTQDEMASFLHVHRETLSDRVLAHYGEDFSTVYKRFADSGKCSLRRNQFVLSKKNAALAIWLGKQWLGQKDTPLEEIVTEVIVKKFDTIMAQIHQAQQERKISDINVSNNLPSY